MQRATRRGVLAAMGLAATAGCSSLTETVSGGGSKRELAGETITERSESFTLKKGEFKAYPLSFDTQSVLLFSVVSDENVDVFTLSRPNYEAYKSGSTDQVETIGELSEQNTKATAKGANVSAGEPVLVVDNTTWAKTPPIADIQVEVEIEAFVRESKQGGSGGN